MQSGSEEEQERRVRPNGLSVRRLRHEKGWSPRQLVDAIGVASERASGIRETITPNLLSGVEERWESIPRTTLRLIADGLDCDPADILDSDPAPTVPENDARH
jgi:DNA-binding Xre family transcriptional regulator